VTVSHRDHVRSRKAFEHVTQFQDAPLADQAAYGRLALKLPFLIRSAGLAQALAFVDQKSGKTVQLLDDLAETIAAVTQSDVGTRAKLIQAARLTDDPAAYLQLSREVLHAAGWYKRLSTSILGIEPGDDE
jgi:CRISPR-associated protein Cmr5